jgi:hypothetical protein
MDEVELKRIAVEAAMERVVGSTSIPVRHFASLAKAAKVIVDEYKEEHKEWTATEQKLTRAIQVLENTLEAYVTELARVRSIKGEKGAPGKDGKDGRDGRDAREVDTEALKYAILAEIRQPKDGKDAVVDTEAMATLAAELAVEKIFSEKLLKKEHIEGLENEIASYRSQLAGKIYGKDTWARGAGTTVSAGSNITLVPKADGTVEINASGGGSGTNVATQYQLTAVQSGSNVTIDLSQLTNFATLSDLIAVYRNNIMQTETLNFTVAGSVVTVLDADAGEVFNITYAYA